VLADLPGGVPEESVMGLRYPSLLDVSPL